MAKAPILYNDGNKWRNWECYNSAKSNVAILVGAGPSLNNIDLTKLSGPGKTVFGLNTTYPAVRPDVWIGMDDPKCYDRRLFSEPFPKIMRGNYYSRDCEGTLLTDCPNTYFASVKKFDHKGDIFYRIGSDTEAFIWDKNVFVTALNIILYMGYRKIYLAGVDFSLDNGEYFHNSIELDDKYKKWNKNLYNHLYRYVGWIASTGRMCGIEISSISPNSKINEIIPYISLDSLNSSLQIPDPGKIYHCGQLEEPEKDKNTLVSSEYKELLKHEHSTTKWGVMAGVMIKQLEEFLSRNNATEVLDYGAGSSSFKKALTLKDVSVYEYDPGVPGIDITPEPRDYAICIDVLEHVEPELLDDVLKDLARVTKKKAYFTIAMYPAKRLLKDGRNAHLILEDTAWWISKLSRFFSITEFSEKNKQLDVEVVPKIPS